MPVENKVIFSDLQSVVGDFDKNLTLYELKYSDIVFEKRVRINCFYCSKYNVSWTCPPKIPDIDYFSLFKEYDNLAVVVYKANFSAKDFDKYRFESTNKVHRCLLSLEKYLYNNNNSLAVSFIGGSCKLCKNGCDEVKCRNKGLARIPFEATGVNVVATMANLGIDVVFPIKNSLQRIGLILW